MRDAQRGRSLAGPVAALGVVAAVVLFAGLFALLNEVDYDVGAGLLTGLALLALGIPLLLVATRHEADPWVRVIIVAALAAKMFGALVRYWMAFEVYGGAADAARYMDAGADLAPRFLEGDLAYEGDRRFVGTPVMEHITGFLVILLGPTILGAFLAFSFLSYWGLFGFYRAFRVAVPDGSHRRYALLVFLLPTLVFWPSSVGKEAWVIAFLGLAAYGAARVLTRQGGYVLAAVGVLGVGIIRPHIALLVLAAVAAGFLRRTRGQRPPLFGPIPQAVGVVALVIASFFGLQQVEEFFGVEEADGVTDAAEEILDETARRTTTGGSEFDAAPLTNPLEFPEAVVTVLFRPWPAEAENVQMLLVSLESLVLMGLFALSWRRVRSTLRQAWRNPYVRMALVFAIGFIIAYAAVGNFGILARQRSQLYPFVIVLISLAPTLRLSREARHDTRAERLDPPAPPWLTSGQPNYGEGEPSSTERSQASEWNPWEGFAPPQRARAAPWPPADSAPPWPREGGPPQPPGSGAATWPPEERGAPWPLRPGDPRWRER